MNAIEKIGGVIFVLDEDDSEKYITTYRAEHNLNQYRIVVDNTTSMPYSIYSWSTRMVRGTCITIYFQQDRRKNYLIG